MRLTVKEIFLKCKDMISIARNRPLFVYRVHHYMKQCVDYRSAKRQAQKNKEFYSRRGIDVLWFETYDGSNQLCHPDVVFWENRYWMIATPYPYGMEEYENPSLFCGDSLETMLPARCNPIAFPSKKGYGSHLSDPSLFCNGDVLYCFYRDTINIGDIIENRICYKELHKDGTMMQERIVLSSFEDGLLSPAVVFCDKKVCLFYVSYINSILTMRKAIFSDNMEISFDEEIILCNRESDWDIWHFDIKSNDGVIEALFLLRSKSNRKEFKLKKGVFDSRAHIVTFKDDVQLPNEINEVMEHPYKSCIVPGLNDKILLSFRDINAVYVMKII